MGALAVLKEAFSAVNSMVNFVEYDEEENFVKIVDEYKKNNPDENKFMDKFLKAVEIEKEERAKLEERVEDTTNTFGDDEIKIENTLNENLKVDTVIEENKVQSVEKIDGEEIEDRIKE